MYLLCFPGRMFATQEAIGVKNRTPEVMDVIKALMAKLEETKPNIGKLSSEEAQHRVEQYALLVFKHADDQDRAGVATKKTALAFHAAFVFLDITRQFNNGELASDIEEKAKYALWKAAEISKALREGRKPQSGAFNEQLDDEEKSEPSPGDAPGGPGWGAPKEEPYRRPDPHHKPQPSPAPAPSSASASKPAAASKPAPARSPQPQYQPAKPTPPLAHQQYSPAAIDSSGSVTVHGKRTKDKMNSLIEGEKLAKHAVSALRFHDVDGAILKLIEALEVLLPHRGDGVPDSMQ